MVLVCSGWNKVSGLLSGILFLLAFFMLLGSHYITIKPNKKYVLQTQGLLNSLGMQVDACSAPSDPL